MALEWMSKGRNATDEELERIKKYQEESKKTYEAVVYYHSDKKGYTDICEVYAGRDNGKERAMLFIKKYKELLEKSDDEYFIKAVIYETRTEEVVL